MYSTQFRLCCIDADSRNTKWLDWLGCNTKDELESIDDEEEQARARALPNKAWKGGCTAVDGNQGCRVAGGGGGMRWKAYECTMPSGIHWLGKVPKHWRILKIKRFSMVKRGASPRPIDDPKYFDDDGVYAWVRIADVTASERYLKTTQQHLSELGKSLSVPLEPGSIFLSIAGTVGKPIITKIKCCIHDGFVYFPRYTENFEFLYYLFASGQPYLGLGKLGTQLNLNTDTVGDIHIGMPSPDEQQAIVEFLDHETERIDSLIAKKQRQIELLNEKRAALISHVVTKGLNPDVKMKDSGVEWLGEIPGHWEVIKLGKISLALQTGPFGSQLHAFDYVDGGIPVINPAHIVDGKILSDDRCSVDEDTFKRLERHRLKTGDIAFGRRGEMGRCALVTEEANGFLCGTGCLRVRLNGRIADPQYVSLFLGMAGVRDHLTLESVGSTMDNLNTGILSRIPVAVPPLEEQGLITDHVKSSRQQMEGAAKAITKSIGFLQEYRTALITAAVTGKIDVRQEATHARTAH